VRRMCRGCQGQRGGQGAGGSGAAEARSSSGRCRHLVSLPCPLGPSLGPGPCVPARPEVVGYRSGRRVHSRVYRSPAIKTRASLDVKGKRFCLQIAAFCSGRWTLMFVKAMSTYRYGRGCGSVADPGRRDLAVRISAGSGLVRAAGRAEADHPPPQVEGEGSAGSSLRRRRARPGRGRPFAPAVE
jgi:hypothetical protein